MKKIIGIIFIGFVLILNACGKPAPVDVEKEIVEEPTELEVIEEDKVEINLDLSGNELIEEIYNNRNLKVMMKSISIYNDVEVETISYYDGLSSRIEANGMVSIYNAEDGVSYFYYEDSKTGNIVYDEEDETEELLVPQFTPIEGIIKTEITDVDGIDVVYLEIEDADTLIKDWYSIEYGILVKTEVYENNELISESYTTEIGSDFDSEEIFGTPKDIELIDITN